MTPTASPPPAGSGAPTILTPASSPSAPVPLQAPPLAEVRAVVVRFRTPGHAREFLSDLGDAVPGTQVIVETERGTRLGAVVEVCQRPAAAVHHRVLRMATHEDLDAHHSNKVREAEATAFCVERILALALPMKLVGVEFAHSGSSAVFSFVSEARVDFRALVKDLARRFHTRIDMRQIGVRDAARLCGGVAVCGRELCCCTFLCSFHPISVRMAKDQNLTLNQDKLSGVCGRLKCCLAYEESAYAELRRGLPKLGKRVITPEGEGRVKDVDVIRRLVRVQVADGRYLEFSGDEIKRPAELDATGDASSRVASRGRANGTASSSTRLKSVADDVGGDDTPSANNACQAPESRRAPTNRTPRTSPIAFFSRTSSPAIAMAVDGSGTTPAPAPASSPAVAPAPAPAAPPGAAPEAPPTPAHKRRRRRRRRHGRGSDDAGSPNAGAVGPALPGATSPGAQPELDPNAGDGDNEALTNIRSED